MRKWINSELIQDICTHLQQALPRDGGSAAAPAFLPHSAWLFYFLDFNHRGYVPEVIVIRQEEDILECRERPTLPLKSVRTSFPLLKSLSQMHEVEEICSGSSSTVWADCGSLYPRRDWGDEYHHKVVVSKPITYNWWTQPSTPFPNRFELSAAGILLAINCVSSRRRSKLMIRNRNGCRARSTKMVLWWQPGADLGRCNNSAMD